MPIIEQGWCPCCQQVTEQETKREGSYIVTTCLRCKLVLSKVRPPKVKK